MSNTDTLERLRAERDQNRAAALALVQADDYDPTSDAVRAAEERASALDNQIERLVGLLDAQTAADALDGRLSKAAKDQERSSGSSGIQTRESWGEVFTRSEAFTGYRGRGTSSMVDVAPVEERALPTGLADLVAAGFTGSTSYVNLTPPPAPTPLLDNISRVNVSSNAVEYVAWSKVAGGADVVAEKGLKPSAEWAPAVTADTLDTVAVWTQLTRQMIEDAPAVRSIIDGELQRDVLREEEEQAAAALAAATLETTPIGPDLLAKIRVAIGMVQENGYNPNALLLNPADYAALDNDVMAQTNGGPVRQATFWGLTPIPSASQAAGTAVVGDFRTAVTQYVRSNVNLYITDSHADTFIRNVFTLLAERRALTAVVRPQALVRTGGTV